MKLYILLVVIFSVARYSDCKSYTNFTLFRTVPMKSDQLSFLSNLSELFRADYWQAPGKLKNPVEFLIAPDYRRNFEREAKNRGLVLMTMLEDVQSEFDKQIVKTYIRRRTESFSWDSFFKYSDILTWLTDLKNAHPTEMSLENIGKTHEGRNIVAAKIVLKDSLKRSTVIVEGGIHAREWVAPAFVTYMLHQILNAASSKDEALRNIASTYEWYFIPVLNADGYEYSHTTDRLWRKNRNPEGGVDINRNFDVAFGLEGVSFNSNHDTYCGDRAFSEPESKAMANFVRSKIAKLEYYLAFHSYGQFMILPFAYTKQHLANFEEMSNIGHEVTRRIARQYGTKYTVGTAYDTVGYLTSGVSGCWVKKAFEVPYVATFELRDSGSHGFALPPSEILPTCRETMDGVLELLSPTKHHAKDQHLHDSRFSGALVNDFDKTLLIVATMVYII